MRSDKPQNTLRILTVNAHKGFTFFNRRFILHELRDAIRATHADIVFLQEVLGAHHRHARRLARWPTISQYEFLADSIWPEFAYGRNAVYPYGHHGNAVLSKFPIAAYDNIDVSVGKHERRGLLHCVLRPPTLGVDLHAICVHLGLREYQRRPQIESLCSLIEEKIPQEAPLFVAGDFNDWRKRAQSMLENCAGLKEIHYEDAGCLVRTFPANLPLFHLDRIYVRNVHSYKPIRLARHPWAKLSDHAPLAAEVSLCQ
ncbi:MAG TPA: endonuclease/exonuclease/phosphatase family protein [Burkholderiaceae bacterium]|nr:endonuclease/exonuclease/phosphatase family protein [Burkholderiaceae bacterium]